MAHCTHCGRELKSARSIARGVGSTCWKYLHPEPPPSIEGTRKARDKKHRRRKAILRKRMEREMYESQQLKFQWEGTDGKADDAHTKEALAP